jgi:hypothetical protein
VIRHVVAWKLKPMEAAERAAAIEEIREALEALVGVVPGLISLTVRPDVSGDEAHWDTVLISDHDSLDAVAGYQAHPSHLEAAAVPRKYAEQRAVVDFEL